MATLCIVVSARRRTQQAALCSIRLSMSADIDGSQPFPVHSTTVISAVPSHRKLLHIFQTFLSLRSSSRAQRSNRRQDSSTWLPRSLGTLRGSTARWKLQQHHMFLRDTQRHGAGLHKFAAGPGIIHPLRSLRSLDDVEVNCRASLNNETGD